MRITFTMAPIADRTHITTASANNQSNIGRTLPATGAIGALTKALAKDAGKSQAAPMWRPVPRIPE